MKERPIIFSAPMVLAMKEQAWQTTGASTAMAYNSNLPRMKSYTTNTAVVSDNEAILRQAVRARVTAAQGEAKARADLDKKAAKE